MTSIVRNALITCVTEFAKTHSSSAMERALRIASRFKAEAALQDELRNRAVMMARRRVAARARVERAG